MGAHISEFKISARQYIQGMSVHAELTVIVNPPQTEDFLTTAAAAQIELRTLLAQTFESQLKTREALGGTDKARNAHHAAKKQQVSKKPKRTRGQIRARGKPGADGKKQPRRSPRSRIDQTEAQT